MRKIDEESSSHELSWLKRLAVFVASQLALSFFYITLFSHYFHYSRRVIVLHMAIVLGLVGALLLPTFGALVASRIAKIGLRKRLLFRLAAIIPALGLALLECLYVADVIANLTWGNNITFRLAIDVFRRPNSYLQTLPQSLIGLLVLVILVIIALAIIRFRFFERLWRSLSETRERASIRRLMPKRLTTVGSRATMAALVLIVLAGYPLCLVATFHLLGGKYVARFDPLYSFVLPDELFPPDAHRMAVMREDARVRREYAAPRSFDRKNVIIIIVDCLRADHLRAYGYERDTTPFLTKLFDDGRLKRVRFAVSTCSETACGVLSTFASKNYSSLTPGNFKLYDLLFDQGYKVWFVLSGNHTAFYDLKRSFGESINLYFDGSRAQRYPPNDDRLIFEGLERVPDFAGAPSFFYFHLMSAHPLGVRREEYERYRPSAYKAMGELLRNGQRDGVLMANGYDNGVLQADDTIRQIFDNLERKGYLENSVVVILGDHGQSFGSHNHYGHTQYLYQEDIAIPILIYDDSKVEYANLEFGGQIDVAPTILERLGIPVPATWDGQSLLKPDRKRYSYHQTSNTKWWRAVLFHTDKSIYKYLRHMTENREELYELTSDPREIHNLITTADPSLVSHLKELLARGTFR